ncbi:MAG: mechanosensitive ion channel family protein [Saprospiraceae bacterium]|nr:mechanosensitive ion channel family protein [Saprospiraceae bacterium]
MEQYFSTEFWQAFNHKVFNWMVDTVPSLLFILLLIVITQWLLRRLTNRLQLTMMKAARFGSQEESLDEREKRVNTLVNILRQTGKVVIWVVFILIMLREINIDIAPILASAGIVGLAIGFGAQEFVRDFISGFFLLIENQIREGDVAVINGTPGLVEKIALRTITLRDFTGTVHIFQSGKINTLSNQTKDWSAAVFEIGVAYNEDIDQVKSVMLEVGEALSNDPDFANSILEPLEVLGIDRFDDSAVVIKARLKTRPGEQWRLNRAFNERLKKRLIPKA